MILAGFVEGVILFFGLGLILFVISISIGWIMELTGFTAWLNRRRAPITPSKYDGWEVEFNPISGRHYPLYKKRYVVYWKHLDKWNTCEKVNGEYSTKHNGAIKIIDKYLDHKGITNIITKL